MNRAERIRHYEEIMDRALEAADRAGSDPEALARLIPDLRKLEAYYTGPEWKEDYAADEAGLLPEGLKRGVLSQDGIWNLLERTGILAGQEEHDMGILARQAAELLAEEPWYAAALSNISSVIMAGMPDLNWAGFYILRGGRLTVGPFQGKPACIHIAPGKGVCGAALERDETVVVPDVHLFPGHIACDGASASEIVIPIHADGQVRAVLDVDSPVKDRFGPAEREELEALVRVIEERMSWE